MFSPKRPDHLICDNCAQSFPETWIAQRKGVKDGKDNFCSPFCHEQFEEGTQLALPLGFNGRKPIVPTRRLQ